MNEILQNVGSKPTISPLHYDDYENLLCQIRGRKEVSFLFNCLNHSRLLVCNQTIIPVIVMIINTHSVAYHACHVFT